MMSLNALGAQRASQDGVSPDTDRPGITADWMSSGNICAYTNLLAQTVAGIGVWVGNSGIINCGGSVG